MIKHTLLLLSGAAMLAGAAAPAAAADYDAPIFIENAPEYVPVEVGSGWYLRGDITYNLDEPVYEFTLFGEETDNDRFGAGAGFGYHFNDWVRADLTVNYIAGDSFRYDDGVDFTSATHTAISGMINGYVDLGTYAGITPYVGAGAGLLYSEHEISIDSPTLGVVDDFSDQQYKFAYALSAGVAYKVTPNLAVDVGYQYLASPGTETIDIDTLTVDEGVDYHQVRVGLRYELW